MSAAKNVLSVETALLRGIQAYEQGDIALGREICRQVLDAVPDQPQALLLDLWLARKSGNPAEIEMAVRRMISAEPAWTSVPRYPSPDQAPRCLDPEMSRFFAGRSPTVGDISDHLPTLFFETLALRPRLIVELGTRGGQSTRTFLAASGYTGSRLLSIDIENCVLAGLPEDAHARWDFVCSDDVAFGEREFAGWCAGRGLAPEIDLLFIDTSHLYAHTVEELRVWLPHLSQRGAAILHDTNLDFVSQRADGSIVTGWNNERGVIRAIEEHLGTRLDERGPFVAVANGWVVRHVPNCNGLTTLRRLAA